MHEVDFVYGYGYGHRFVPYERSTRGCEVSFNLLLCAFFMTHTLSTLLPALRQSARYARYAQYVRHLFCLAALVALALPAQAATKTWDGTTGNWSDDTKWSPAGAPLATDDVVVDAGSVTLTVDRKSVV